MSIQNSWIFVKSLFDSKMFLEKTRNTFQFVNQKPFVSKKHPEDVGVLTTLLIMYDDMDYGVDKKGNKRDNNVLNTFEVTILNGQTELPFKKGDKVSLVGYIPEKSYVIGFDVLLRFKDIKKAGV
jgi:hypothetical protein